MTRSQDGAQQVLACITLVLAGLTALPASADGKPQDWLARMEQALGSLNYEGTLVQMHGNEASVMHVVHRVDAGSTTERITAMDEVGREIIRRGDEVTCIFPDQRTVIVGRRNSSAISHAERARSSLSGSSAAARAPSSSSANSGIQRSIGAKFAHS